MTSTVVGIQALMPSPRLTSISLPMTPQPATHLELCTEMSPHTVTATHAPSYVLPAIPQHLQSERRAKLHRSARKRLHRPSPLRNPFVGDSSVEKQSQHHTSRIETPRNLSSDSMQVFQEAKMGAVSPTTLYHMASALVENQRAARKLNERTDAISHELHTFATSGAEAERRLSLLGLKFRRLMAKRQVTPPPQL
ncbi:hypothetical protein C8Q74DRAFT_1222575 [Fomes fomentarius]|nr:hypothetical protein C8Q74DRAFT_1222575 [Fomes fomentarius]